MTSPRVLIVCDDTGKWFVRRVRMTEHNLDLDQMIYHCDEPLGGPYDDLAGAVARVQRLPRGKRPKNVARETFTRNGRARA